MKPGLQWLVARLGEDMNWWVDETSDDVYWGMDAVSVLEPKQVAYLREELKRYEAYGFDLELLDDAFHAFEVSSELSDGRLKLVASQRSLTEDGAQLFALPDLLDEAQGVYHDFLDKVSALRIKLLNATHEYYENLTEQDMDEEIQTRNADRYFSVNTIHVFNELEDILTWKPAEWDDTEEEARLIQNQGEVEHDDESEDEDEGEEDASKSWRN